MIDLSVHLITYNNEAHIEDTITSILQQNVNFNYEIVVGDDCSTDRTLDIINHYASKNPSLFKIKKNDTQLGILRNFKTTLDRCNGNYIFDIAGDDVLKGDSALQKMVNILKNDSSLGYVDSGYDRLEDHNNSISHFKNKDSITAKELEYKSNVLLGKITPIGTCYNKAHLYKHVDFETYLEMNINIEDYPILVDLIMNTNVARIDESLHIYRIHENSYSHSKQLKNNLYQKNQMKQLFDFFSNKYSFHQDLINTYKNNHLKEILFLAGYFEDKELGKDIYPQLNSKTLVDTIHYLASQSSFFRKLISLKKRLLRF